MQYLLGIDLGSSSVKVALVEAEGGRCVARASAPGTEAPIKALRPGWAEQAPADWWAYLKEALRRLGQQCPQADLRGVAAIGISYQMHGLVCLDEDGRVLRDAIIWCDSRGVPYGEGAPLPGNFTAAKLAWVKEHEPELFGRIRHIMLPGDWLAMRLGAPAATTACGLSEMMLWEFGESGVRSSECGGLSVRMLDYFGFPKTIVPPMVPTFGVQGRVDDGAAAELGLSPGTPIAYRAGDQPNNAFSLAVLEPGQVASTAGTSGVVFGIRPAGQGSTVQERLNTFLHVNGNLGLMHCTNGCGIMNSWLRGVLAPGMAYDDINAEAATVPPGSEGLSVVPFGNGAERVLANRDVRASVHGIDFNHHGRAHLMRAAQEGIAFSLYYGMELMGPVTAIHAGRANMFLSPVFRRALAGVSGATIDLYDTDGSVGAARGAGVGAGIYASATEALAPLRRLGTEQPADRAAYTEAYARWKEALGQSDLEQ